MKSRLKLFEREEGNTYVDLHVDSLKRLSATGIRSGINENLRDTWPLYTMPDFAVMTAAASKVFTIEKKN
jgi:hypothetical protein